MHMSLYTTTSLHTLHANITAVTSFTPCTMGAELSQQYSCTHQQSRKYSNLLWRWAGSKLHMEIWKSLTIWMLMQRTIKTITQFCKHWLVGPHSRRKQKQQQKHPTQANTYPSSLPLPFWMPLLPYPSFLFPSSPPSLLFLYCYSPYMSFLPPSFFKYLFIYLYPTLHILFYVFYSTSLIIYYVLLHLCHPPPYLFIYYLLYHPLAYPMPSPPISHTAYTFLQPSQWFLVIALAWITSKRNGPHTYT